MSSSKNQYPNLDSRKDLKKKRQRNYQKLIQTVALIQVRQSQGILYQQGEDHYQGSVSVLPDRCNHLTFHMLLVTVNPVIILLVGPPLFLIFSRIHQVLITQVYLGLILIILNFIFQIYLAKATHLQVIDLNLSIQMPAPK